MFVKYLFGWIEIKLRSKDIELRSGVGVKVKEIVFKFVMIYKFRRIVFVFSIVRIEVLV